MRAIAAMLCLLLVPVGCERKAGADDPVMVKNDDAEMKAAMAKARETAPEFWRKFDAPANGEADFAVKVPIKDGNETEYFWLTQLTKVGDKVSGTVDNAPSIVKTVTQGQRLEVTRAEIADWLYIKEGKMHGNYTLRPLFKSMDPAQVTELKRALAEP